MSEQQRKYDLLNNLLHARDGIADLAREPGAAGTELGQLANMVADAVEKIHDALDAINTWQWKGDAE